MIKVSKAVMLTGEDAGLHNLVGRIHGSHIHRGINRRDPILIINLDNQKRIIRYAMGGSGIKGLSKDGVAIDYDGIDTLGLPYQKDTPINCNLLVRKASKWEQIRCFWNHPDVPTQLSVRLGLLSVVLGVSGLGLGLLSLF